MRKPNKIVNALLDAVWLMRWNKKKTSMTAIMEPEEAQKIVDGIFEELDKIGYEIKRKGPKKRKSIKFSSPNQF